MNFKKTGLKEQIFCTKTFNSMAFLAIFTVEIFKMKEACWQLGFQLILHCVGNKWKSLWNQGYILIGNCMRHALMENFVLQNKRDMYKFFSRMNIFLSEIGEKNTFWFFCRLNFVLHGITLKFIIERSFIHFLKDRESGLHFSLLQGFMESFVNFRVNSTYNLTSFSWQT